MTRRTLAAIGITLLSGCETAQYKDAPTSPSESALIRTTTNDERLESSPLGAGLGAALSAITESGTELGLIPNLAHRKYVWVRPGRYSLVVGCNSYPVVFRITTEVTVEAGKEYVFGCRAQGRDVRLEVKEHSMGPRS